MLSIFGLLNKIFPGKNLDNQDSVPAWVKLWFFYEFLARNDIILECMCLVPEQELDWRKVVKLRHNSKHKKTEVK